MRKKTIIITGASSGLGAALAIGYADSSTRLFLFGRSADRLSKIEVTCKSHNAEVRTINIDVENNELMYSAITKIGQQYKIDIVIACAGVSAGTLDGLETTAQIRKIFATNLDGSLNTIIPSLSPMMDQKSGIIVIISSMAGLMGLSSAPAYSASKAAIKVYGDAMRSYLKPFGIDICVVIPGYIDTPMTKVNSFPMPFKISAQKAAEIIIRNVAKRKPVITFPILIYFFLKILNLLPTQLIDYINSKLPSKPNLDLEQ